MLLNMKIPFPLWFFHLLWVGPHFLLKLIFNRTTTMSQVCLFYKGDLGLAKAYRYFQRTQHIIEPGVFKHEIFQILSFPTASPSWESARGLTVIPMQLSVVSYLTPGTENSSVSCSILQFTKTIPELIPASHQDPDSTNRNCSTGQRAPQGGTDCFSSNDLPITPNIQADDRKTRILQLGFTNELWTI